MLSQLHEVNIKTSLDYNYKEIGKEYENIIDEEAKKMMITLSRSQIYQQVDLLLMEVRPRDFCLKQVLKLCYYIQKIYSHEILSMKCDFYRDANNKIWLFHASDILSRNRIRSNAERLEEEVLEKEKQERLVQLEEQNRLKQEKRREERQKQKDAKLAV